MKSMCQRERMLSNAQKIRPAEIGRPDATVMSWKKLFLLCVSLIEFVNAARSIDELHLTGVERMR